MIVVANLVIIMVALTPVWYLFYQAIRLARFERLAREWGRTIDH